MSKLVVFDVDGTLLNSWPVFEREIHLYSIENNLSTPCVDTIKVHYANHLKVDFKWGVELEEQRYHLHSVYQRVDNKKNEVPPLFDGAKELLRKWKDMDYKLGIVTSKPSEPMKRVLDHHDLNSLFSGIRTSCDVHKRGEKEKPAPDQLLSLASELGFRPERTIMVGYTTMDIEMGVNAGAYTIGVTWGNHCHDLLRDAGADKIISNDFDELLQHIKKIS